jgi:hypothetical protein
MSESTNAQRTIIHFRESEQCARLEEGVKQKLQAGKHNLPAYELCLVLECWCLFFDSAVNWTQGLLHARQVFYHR